MSVNGVVATLSTFAALSPEASAAAALSVPTSPFWYPTSTPRPETLLNSGRAVFETVHSEYLSLIQPARTRTSDRSAANCICSVPGSRSSAVCVITQNCVPAKGNSAAWRATSCCARDIARGASLASSLTRASRSCSAFSFASAAALFASAARASAEAIRSRKAAILSSAACFASSRSGLADRWSNQSRTPDPAALNVKMAANNASHLIHVSVTAIDDSTLSSVGAIDDDEYYDHVLIVSLALLMPSAAVIGFGAGFVHRPGEQRQARREVPTRKPSC